jgi:TonB family protein
MNVIGILTPVEIGCGTFHPMYAGRVPNGPRAVCAAARSFTLLLLVAALSACVGEPARSIRQSAEALVPSAVSADELPMMLNEGSPFYYPESAWTQRIQGNVTLRLHVDASGRAVRDSTTVSRTSGVPSLDSAALEGSLKLRFRPARRNGSPLGVSLLFPVHFRHPDGPPFPGDTLLQRPS